MGLFGGSKSSSTQTTNNSNYQVSSVDNSVTDIFTDNRVNIDNRQDNYLDASVSVANDGTYAGVNTGGGAFTVTDGGAFNLVGNAVNGVIDLTNNTVGVMGSLAETGFNLADSLGRETMRTANDLAQGSFNLSDSLTQRSNNLAESLAGYNADVARDSISSSTAITGALLNYASQESEQSRNLSESTTRYALQAVDSISRSDGQQLGVKSLETQKWLFIGLGAVALGAIVLRGK